MKLLTLLSFAAQALAAAVNTNKRDAPLTVSLEKASGAGVKATITNTGASSIKVFKAGSILDSNLVEKTEVFSSGNKIAFDGLRLRLQTTGLSDDAFQTIAAGQAVEVEWDPAVVHDLSAGGSYDFVAKGVFHTAEAGSDSISGAIPFTSNTLTTSVDGAAASKVRRDFHEHAKRQIVQSDCTSTRRTSTVNALSNCLSLSNAARTAATSGSATKLAEYFMSSSSATRSAVASGYQKVAGECDSSTSGVSREYCTDVYGACSSNVLAYTVPSQSYMVNCNIYYTALPALTKSCHAQDQATTTLHETTHLSQVLGTQDLAYGYNGIRGLSASQALNNADTYALYANAIYAGC